MTDNKPKPTNFGFDADFNDLSKVQPATRSQAGVKEKAKPRKPKVVKARNKPAVLAEREAAADKVAKSMGFESREQKPVMLKKRRRTHHDEPVDQLSIRGPVRVLNDFITYCEKENLSYWEAMEKLLKA